MIENNYYKSTRLLTTDDIPSILEILSTAVKISKNDKIPNTEIEHLVNTAITSNDDRVVGYFQEDKLVSYLFQTMSKRMSTWHMMLLGTRSIENWNYKKNGLEYCWANAMDYAENLGVYKVYWSMPTKWARTQTKTIHTSDVWKRYDIYTEAIIPPYQFPKWEDQGISFGKIPKPHNVTVKLAILKNEFRKFNIDL
jgi:hypothetical protein